MKPLDFGGGGVTGSVNADGRMIALNFYHPQHGYVTLTSAEPFDESQRYNPAAVRAYRASLTEQDGFGIEPDAPIVGRSVRLRESAIPEIELDFGAVGTLKVTTFACAQGAVQQVEGTGRDAVTLWGGRVCLQRCAYTQLTEGGPVPMPPLRLHVFAQDDLVVIHNPELPAAVAIAGLDVSGCNEQAGDQPLAFGLLLSSHTLDYGIGLSVEEAVANARWLLEHASLDQTEADWHAFFKTVPDDPLLRRGLAYAHINAVPVGEGICLLTDHMLLPLSWNRDAYFAARALLYIGRHKLVRRHLLWMFEQAERIDGFWARCYTANGKMKDGAFQLDQQLYPLLELADYVRATGDTELAKRLSRHVKTTLSYLYERFSPEDLLATDETPADDPIALPYHFSSHVLLWHTLERMERVGIKTSVEAEPCDGELLLDFQKPPRGLREVILRAFTAERDGRRIFAYAIDGKGNYHFYHDSNDFPLALAPAWRFVPADDPRWRATVDFAFSEANVGGFYAGHLGSVHSRAPWALGDVQKLIIAQALGDSERAEKARASLRHAAQPDGSLPEAYNASDGSVFSRHWFVWPSAALACVELGAFD